MIFRLSMTPVDHLVLDTAVEAFRVLAHDDDVDVLEARRDRLERP